MKVAQTDYLIIGAGIIGLAFAYRIKQAEPDARVILLEKEDQIGKHASGRNSGVLHSGIYYNEGSIKAKLCAKGAREMRKFCEEHDLTCKAIGKVIVPTEAEHDASVDALFLRGQANGVNVKIIDKIQLQELEPEARTASNRALYLPDTCVVESKKVLKKLVEQLEKLGVEILLNCRITQINSEKNIIKSHQGNIQYKKMINAAGACADQVATQTGLKHSYSMLPFRGVYFKMVGDIAKRIQHLIYPIPNLDMPFLGVHTTSTPDGSVYLGPTAMPSFGRENYHGIKNFNLKDTANTLSRVAGMYLKNTQGLRKHVMYESQTLLFREHLLKRAKKLVPNLALENIESCSKRGIRPQLYNNKTGKLEMDFVVEKHENTLHILNAISPAFTSSFGFAGWLFENSHI